MLKNSKVVKAQERLDNAVSRLESALKAGSGAELSAELAARLRDAKAENESLKNVRENVSHRLQGAIDSIKSILEN